MRTELSLSSYSFENAVFHVLRRRSVALFLKRTRINPGIATRTPRYSPATLSGWYRSVVPEHTARLLNYYLSRTIMVVEMVEVAEVITKHS